jgi:hypothetical protein
VSVSQVVAAAALSRGPAAATAVAGPVTVAVREPLPATGRGLSELTSGLGLSPYD